MKSSENTGLVYIFPEKIWLQMNDVFVFTILWSFSHHQNTIQICQKCKEEKCCSVSAQSWYDTSLIFLTQPVGDFYLMSLLTKTPCKSIQSQSIQKSRTEAVKTFWANEWKASVLDGCLLSTWLNFFSFWDFPLPKPKVGTEALILLFLRGAYMKYLHWLTGESPDLSHFWWEKNFGPTRAESNSWAQKPF